MNSRKILLQIAFFCLGSISIFYIKLYIDQSTQQLKHESNTPDSYMINATYFRTNIQGERDTVVFSPLVKHYKQQDMSEFHNPQIRIYKKAEEWLITAKEAQGTNGATEVNLYKNVKVQEFTTNKERTSILSTERLTVFPKKKFITTNEFVTIEQPGLKMTGKGLEGDLNTGNVQLLSKTRGEYDPTRLH